MKLKQRLLSVMLVFAMLVTYMPITNVIVREVHAEESNTGKSSALDISSGNIVINGSTYKQGDTVKNLPDTITITGASKNSYTIIIDGYTGSKGPINLSNLSITSTNKAPLTIMGGSDVILNIDGSCVFENQYVSTSAPNNYPGIYVVGKNNVEFVGDSGKISALGGSHCPAIGGGCRDQSRTDTTFNSDVIFNGPEVNAVGGTNAPCIGTGRACLVKGGKFEFKKGRILANSNTAKGVGIGLCEIVTLDEATKAGLGEANSNLTLEFTGAAVTAKGGSYAAAIGAGEGQNAGSIVINGGSITATAGSKSPVIGGGGKSAKLKSLSISGSAIVTLTGTATDNIAVGDGVDVQDPKAEISISDSAIVTIETPCLLGRSPLNGKSVNLAKYKKPRLTLRFKSKDYTEGDSAEIPYAEFHDNDQYLLTGFFDKTGVYYKKVLKTDTRAKRFQYMEIRPCEGHSFICNVSAEDPTKHTRKCILCNSVESPADHNWQYTVSDKTITETCIDCKLQHTLTVKDTETNYDSEIKGIDLDNDDFCSTVKIMYYPEGSSNPVEPKDAGKYTASVSVGTVSCSAILTIQKSDLIKVTAKNYNGQYDGDGHNIELTVTEPIDDISVEFSSNGVNYSETVPTFTDVGKHTTWYRVTHRSATTVCGKAYVNITPREITGVTLTGLDKPHGAEPFDTVVDCDTAAVATRTPLVHWRDSDEQEVSGNAKFNTAYTAYFTLYPNKVSDAFSSTISTSAITINGIACAKIDTNPDGSITVYTEPIISAKAKVTSVGEISDRTGVVNGVVKSVEGLGLPQTVDVDCEDESVTKLDIKWNVAGSSYNEEEPAAQSFTINGEILVPDYLDSSSISTSALINVKVLCASVKPVTATVAEGLYKDTISLGLSTETEGATIHYTVSDGETTSEEQEYDNNVGISLEAVEGRPVVYTVTTWASRSDLSNSTTSTFTYRINKADGKSPSVKISINGTTFEEVLEKITFGWFSTDARKVTLEFKDDETGVAESSYYISEKELTKTELEELTGWKACDKNGCDISVTDIGKYIVYAKAVDGGGNITYASSNGIVIYSQSTTTTTSINIIKGVTESINIHVDTNGNEIDTITIDNKTPSVAPHFDASTGNITIYDDAYDSLAVRDESYAINITYKPLGEEYIDHTYNTAPIATTVQLYVVKPKLRSITTPDAIIDIPNGTALTEILAKLPESVDIDTEDPAIKTAIVDWDTSRFASGKYDVNSLDESSFTIKGTIQLPDTVSDNNVSRDVIISLKVNAAGKLSRPVANLNSFTFADSCSITLTSSDNADIYYTLDGSAPTLDSTRYDATPIQITETTTIKAFCHKEGHYDSGVSTYTYTKSTADESYPTGSISIGKESFWSSLWSGVLYQFFTKKTQVVTITGADEESGISAIFYYISPVELNASSLKEVTGWELYTEPLHLDPNVGGIIYAKIINGAGKESFVNSNGIVVFTDPEKVTDSVTYVKGTGNDVEFTVKLNGNSIKAMRNGGTTLSPTHYSQTYSGNIVLSASYLETLSTGNYTFYVDYYPMGINNSNAAGNSEAPASTSLRVLISAKSTGANTGGGSSIGTPNVSIIIPQDPNFEGNATGTSTKTDSSGVVHNIETVTYTDKSKTITDTSTSKDKTKTVVVTEKDAKGATTTVATKITTKDGTETYTVTEYVSANETKTTTNKSDTKGNTYERVYVTNKNGASSESIVSTVNDVKTTDVYKVDVSGNLSQTYSTTQELNGEIIDVTVKGSGTQTSPKYTESYTLVEDGLDVCNVTVTRTNSKATATASVVKTNEAGNKVVISADLLDDMLTAASWNDVNGSLPNVSTVHTFSTKRKAVSDIDVTYKVMNDSGNKRYTLMFNTDDIVAGNKIRQFRYTGGKYVMLGANYKTVSDSGNLSITPDKNYTYLLAGPETYKSINDSIKKSAVFANTSTAQVSKGKSTYFKLDDEFDSRNVKSITYKSKNGLVASVNNSGKVTAKHSGTAKITATIKFVNGGSKTITRSIKVK